MSGRNRKEHVKTWRKRKSTRMRAAFGGCCGICGYDRCNAALAFHHLDPTKKRFGLAATSVIAMSWTRIVEELRKCVLLCHNCHMEVEYGDTEIADDIPRFNESHSTYVNSQGKIIGV